MTQPLNMDVHAPRNPDAYWPPGFIERAEAQARAIGAQSRVRTAAEALALVTTELPGLIDAGAVALGLPKIPEYLHVLVRDALAACVASVTVTTEGTVTVVDHRTPSP